MTPCLHRSCSSISNPIPSTGQQQQDYSAPSGEYWQDYDGYGGGRSGRGEEAGVGQYGAAGGYGAPQGGGYSAPPQGPPQPVRTGFAVVVAVVVVVALVIVVVVFAV